MQTAIESSDLHRWIDQQESPIHVICADPMASHAESIRFAARQRGIELKVHFARKANKCLSFVKQARRLGLGVDVAGVDELNETIESGILPQEMICTAAIKSRRLIRTCLDQRVIMVVDNRDELVAISEAASSDSRPARIALRIGGFHHDGARLSTRFGLDCRRDRDVLATLDQLPVSVRGVHFHLENGHAAQRATAIRESLDWIDRLRESGHDPEFVDMGGGFPVSSIDSSTEWTHFWKQLRCALLGEREPITYQNHGLGLSVIGGKVAGSANVYPSFQPIDAAQWLASILDDEVDGESIAQALIRHGIQLHCEPGRSLMGGCGMTVARVEYVKPDPDQGGFIGLAMNQTQCRTTHDDFLFDPILLRDSDGVSPPTSSVTSGYLVGAYCTESELISTRRFEFPEGIGRGDLIVLPNTAGYWMHFRESRSHRFPLAKNLVFHPDDPNVYSVDPIDLPRDVGVARPGFGDSSRKLG